VACLTDGTIVVSGQKGLMPRSRDQGKTWEKLDTGVKRDLLSVHFATPQVGVAVGDFGTMAAPKTADDVKKIPLPTDLVLPEDVVDIVEPGDILLYDVDFATSSAAGRGRAVPSHHRRRRPTWSAQKSPVETTLSACSSPTPATALPSASSRSFCAPPTVGRLEQITVPGRKGFVPGLRRGGAGQGRLGDRRQHRSCVPPTAAPPGNASISHQARGQLARGTAGRRAPRASSSAARD
jgi:hypothetical protein